jgi:hypothetical protein
MWCSCRSDYSECFKNLRLVADQLTAMMKQSGQVRANISNASAVVLWITVLQGVRASVRPEEAQRKVKEWQDNFKAYQTALQRLSTAPPAPPPASSAPANLVSVSADSASAASTHVASIQVLETDRAVGAMNSST